MDKISTSELIAKVSASTRISPKMVKAVLVDLVQQVDGHTSNGTAVQITGLGKFYPHDRKARVMVCPLDKKEKEIPAKRVLSFKASKKE